jgi:hypothetical protein
MGLSQYLTVLTTISFIKFLNKGFDEKLVNTIKKFYFHARIQIGTLNDRMNVNRGVL